VARKYINPSRQTPARSVASLGGRAVDEFRSWVDYTYPGSRPEDVIANYTRQTAPQDVPGAKLDGYPWAASWGSFLAAVRDKSDPRGARSVIRQVMESSRPVDALGERVPGEGGFLVPWRLSEQVFAYMTRAAVWPRATIVPMDSLWQAVPVLDNPSQSGGGQALGGLTFSLIEEASPYPASTPSFGRLQLEARKVGALLKGTPNELLADSPALGDFLARVVAMGLEWWLDDYFISTGTGAGQPQALLNAPAGYVVARTGGAGKVVHLDIVTMLKALHPASKASATWLLSEDAFDQLLELYEIIGTAPAGQMIPPPQTLVFDTQIGMWRLLGVPAVVTDHQPAAGTTGDVMLCDLSQYLIGMRSGLVVEVAPLGAGFPNDTSDIRIRWRGDGRFWPQSSYTLANGKVTSPLVILQ
jgi:HK97 family phage major capsid protein